MSLQRKLLLSVVTGYNTISHDAVRLMAAVIPIDLIIEVGIQNDKKAGIDHRENKKQRTRYTLIAFIYLFLHDLPVSAGCKNCYRHQVGN